LKSCPPQFAELAPAALWAMKNQSLAQHPVKDDELWFTLSSGEWIRTADLRVTLAPSAVWVKILNPCHWNVPRKGQGFVRRILQTLAPAASTGVSQTDERWFLLARHAAVVDRCAYSNPFTWVRQEL